MNIPTTTEPAALAVDHRAVWCNFTEDLIFAAAFCDDPRTCAMTWLRHLDNRRITYNRDEEMRKCRALCDAIHAEFAQLPTRIERAHAANDSKTFRLCHADLLPRCP